MERSAGSDSEFLGRTIGSPGELFWHKLITREFPPQGEHISMIARASDGHRYFCKRDSLSTPVRMREALFSKLITELGIPTPEFAILEDEGSGETFFGSRWHQSTADESDKKRFLRTERRDDLNRHLPFPQRMLSQLYAFDLFIGNNDRSIDNLILHREGSQSGRLCPIDFALANLGSESGSIFPVESTETVQVGRQLRLVHGFCPSSALQMVDGIFAIPPDVFMGFFQDIPPDWIDLHERKALNEFWNGAGLEARIQLLRSGLKDGSLL